MLELCKKEECLKKPHWAKCGEQFEDQKLFLNLFIKENYAKEHVERKYKITSKPSSNTHPDLQWYGGLGQVSHKGTGLPGQP